jgi:hypothetical protein
MPKDIALASYQMAEKPVEEAYQPPVGHAKPPTPSPVEPRSKPRSRASRPGPAGAHRRLPVPMHSPLMARPVAVVAVVAVAVAVVAARKVLSLTQVQHKQR